MPAYTTQMGQACILIGSGTLVTAIGFYSTPKAWPWLFFVLGLALGVIKMLCAQKRYNGGVF